MNKPIFVFCLVCFSTVLKAYEARDYEREIYALLDVADHGKALEVLEAWRLDNGEKDPQYWVAGGNVWFSMAFRPTLNLPDLSDGSYRVVLKEDGGLSIVNPNTGDVVGQIGEGKPVISREGMNKAISYLNEGIRRNPHRLDIFIGRAHLYRSMGDIKGEIASLESFVSDIRPLEGRIETGPGQSLKGDLAAYQLEMLMAYAREHLQKDQEADFRAAEEIAKLVIRFYPNRPHGYNLHGAVMSGRGRWQEAKRWFQLALKQDREDALVLFNLAICHERLGEMKLARERYERIIQLDNAPDLVQEARSRLSQYPAR